nr:FliH/SctL family protein [uncultured Acetatifactor sp.]
MSSNLVKHIFTTLSEDKEKLVIDNNDRIRRRLEALGIGQGESGGGFVSGLAVADVIEVPEDAAGNVIKAQDEARELLEQAKAQARETTEQAKAQAESILEEARAKAHAEREQVLEEARRQGYMEGMSKAQAHEGAMEQEYLEKTQALENEYQQQIDLLEPDLVEAITGIYEHVFHVELSSYREILTGLISDVLHKLEGSRSFIIHVSKDDYAYVSMQKKQILAGAVSENTMVDVVEDAAVSRNECMIETENGIFDCGLGSQLSELKKRLTLLAWEKES